MNNKAAVTWPAPPKGVPLRTPMHPGRLLARTCLVPLGLNQSEAARLLGLSRRRLHELVHGQRAMSPDTAIRDDIMGRQRIVSTMISGRRTFTD